MSVSDADLVVYLLRRVLDIAQKHTRQRHKFHKFTTNKLISDRAYNYFLWSGTFVAKRTLWKIKDATA
ncbi:MAG: hypothetical protein V7K24_31710 [Nostoc sp.]